MTGDEIPIEIEQVNDPAQTWQQMLEETRARANEAKGAVADQLLKAADAIRQEAQASGEVDATMQAERVARSLEQAGLFLDSHSIEDIGGEVAQAFSGAPVLALVVTFVVGVVIGLALGRR